MRYILRTRVEGFPSSMRRPGLGVFGGRGLRLDACIRLAVGGRVCMSLPLILLCGCPLSFACSRDDDMRCGLPLGFCYLDIDLIAYGTIPSCYGYIYFYASAFGAVDVSAFPPPTL